MNTTKNRSQDERAIGNPQSRGNAMKQSTAGNVSLVATILALVAVLCFAWFIAGLTPYLNH